ncbi:anti-sigma factor [Mycobacteroides abscessus]|uniref:anti-sigma factor n=1 Tax=Mycobacteroides abscessus TaxID=36809 RepID=UPI000C25E0C9|nr:anti-sigma factor [Mycobacteroides abscessus]
MTEAHTTHSGSHPDDRSLRFEMAARLENLAMMRTVVAAAATVDDLDMDMVADLKLATDEACTRLVRSSVPNAMLVVRLDFHLDRLAMAVYSHCQPGDVFPLDSFSWHVLSSLADHVETFERAHPDDPVGHIVGVSLTKLRDAGSAVRVANG